jgi:hypothetical protein
VVRASNTARHPSTGPNLRAAWSTATADTARLRCAARCANANLRSVATACSGDIPPSIDACTLRAAFSKYIAR